MRLVKVALVSILAVLAMSAFIVGAAYAFESEWMIEGETLSEMKVEEEKLSLVSKPVTLLVPSLEITISCKGTEGSGKILKGGTEEIKATLTSCSAVGSEACTVEPIAMETKVELIEAGGVYYDKVEAAKEGKPLSTVVIKGEKCKLPKESTVKGAFATKVVLEESLEPVLTFSKELSEVVNKELKAESKSELTLTFGEKTAYLSGEFVPPLSIPRPVQRAPFTRLCKGNYRTCPAGTFYPTETWVKASNETEITFGLGTTPVIETTCAESEFEAKTLSAGAAPLKGTSPVNGLDFNNCSGNCSVEAIGMPYDVQFVAIGGGDGQIVVRNPTFKIVCGGKTCKYGLSTASFWVTGGEPGGEPAKYSVDNDLLKVKAGSDAACNEDGFWQAGPPLGGAMKYKIFNPEGALYITR